MRQTDVLVIGGGLAGVAAADEITQNSNYRVTLLSSGSGASPYIHGICMPVGRTDSQELLYEDTLRSGYYQNNSALVRRLCRGSMELKEYLEALCLEPDHDEEGLCLLHSLGSTVPRIIGIHNSTGPVILNALRKRLDRTMRYCEMSGQRAMELICESGRAVGAKCYDAERDCFYYIYAKAVILATGGFGRLFPESTNTGDIGGDGCAMAYLAGAAFTDMEFIQFEPGVVIWPPKAAGKGILTTMFYDGAVLRGRDGNRFMLDYGEAGECVSKDLQSACIYREIRKNGGTPHGGVWFDATGVSEKKWEGVYRNCLNHYLACGIDLRKEMAEVAPAAHTTCGGVQIDENCRTAVPGLIVCGEAAGGLHGANRLGGNAGLETLVFGRIAGKTAISEVKKDLIFSGGSQEHANQAADRNMEDMRDRLKELMRGSLNIIRSSRGLKEGLQGVFQMQQELGEYENCYEKHRMYNDLLTVQIAMMSALERDSSKGCHLREDAEEGTERYRVEIKRNGSHMEVLRKHI